MPTLRERVLKVLAYSLAIPESRLIDDARLREDIGGDDLDLIEMLVDLEAEFPSIVCTDDVAMHWLTVGDVWRGVQKLHEVAFGLDT